MSILIVEDELPAFRRLQQLIQQILPSARIEAQIDSVQLAVQRLQNSPAPDLIFLDIQLADDLSFSIFDQIKIQTPVIFTTAFDQYAIRAFAVHSVDYLLKPIEPEALNRAISKYQDLFQNKQKPPSPTIDMQAIVEMMQQPHYRERFLVKVGSSLVYIPVTEISYLYSEQSIVFAKKLDGKQYHIDATLDQLAAELDPASFFRISRKAIIQLPAIQKIDTYFNGRLILQLQPAADFQATVSRDRVNAFKAWLDR